MTLQSWLDQTIQRLTAVGVETARLDALVLVEDALGQDRAHLLAHPERHISPPQLRQLGKQTARRSQHVPLAYVRGRAEFYGRTFLVNEHVLVPRPESEALIDLLKELQLPRQVRIADIGTGSGCLGLTSALEIPHSELSLYDIDAAALDVARANARRLKVKASCHISDLLSKLRGSYDLMLANLPYVPTDHPVNAAAGHEPRLALFAGPDGLDLYRKFWQQVEKQPAKPRFIITESFPFQHRKNQQLAEAAGYYQHSVHDFAQCFMLS